MQVVIDIHDTPKNDHERWVLSHDTPLPKGHGRLIDADVITKDLNTLQDAFRIYQTMDKSSVSIVCMAEIILEADKEG